SARSSESSSARSRAACRRSRSPATRDRKIACARSSRAFRRTWRNPPGRTSSSRRSAGFSASVIARPRLETAPSRSAPERVRRILEEPAQRVELDGLDEVILETRAAGPYAVGLLAPSRHRREDRLANSRKRSDAFRDVVSAHHGHAEIEHHDVRMELLDRVERGAAVVDRDDVLSDRLEEQLQAVGRVLVVVDDEHAKPVVVGFRLGRPRFERRRGLSNRKGKVDDELAALAEPFAARLHDAAVQLDDAPDQREADAETALTAQRLGIDLREEIEDALDVARCDPAPVVLDADLDVAA